jgi:hypothetical protein
MLLHQNVPSKVTHVSVGCHNEGDAMLYKGARASKGHTSSSKGPKHGEKSHLLIKYHISSSKWMH